MGKYKVTGRSGQTEVIEADYAHHAVQQFVEHHGEPSTSTVEVFEAEIIEEDTARG